MDKQAFENLSTREQLRLLKTFTFQVGTKTNEKMFLDWVEAGEK